MNAVWIFKIKSRLLFARQSPALNGARDRLQPYKFINVNTTYDIPRNIPPPIPPKTYPLKIFPRQFYEIERGGKCLPPPPNPTFHHSIFIIT